MRFSIPATAGSSSATARYRIVRPEEQAMWTPRRPAAEWDAADATFVGIGDDEADGRWRYRQAARRDLADGL